jgi:hypothetical protein
VDVRRPWVQYLIENHLRATDVLSDGTHLNEHGNWLLAELTKRYLRDTAALPQATPAGLVRDYTAGSDFIWNDGRIRLEFDGNRIDADEADVRIDGKKPSESRNCISSRSPPTRSTSIGRRSTRSLRKSRS